MNDNAKEEQYKGSADGPLKPRATILSLLQGAVSAEVRILEEKLKEVTGYGHDDKSDEIVKYASALADIKLQVVVAAVKIQAVTTPQVEPAKDKELTALQSKLKRPPGQHAPEGKDD